MGGQILSTGGGRRTSSATVRVMAADNGVSKIGDDITNTSSKAVKDATSGITNALDGLVKFSGGIAKNVGDTAKSMGKNVGGFADELKDGIVTQTSKITDTTTGLIGLKGPAQQGGEHPLDKFRELENPLMTMFIDLHVEPAFRERFPRVMACIVAVNALAALYLVYPLFFCLPIATYVVAYICYLHPNRIGWRAEVAAIFSALLTVYVGLWASNYFPCREQAEAAEAARSAARSVSIAIFGAESDDNALIYVAASHMLLATRSWIFKQKKE